MNALCKFLFTAAIVAFVLAMNSQSGFAQQAEAIYPPAGVDADYYLTHQDEPTVEQLATNITGMESEQATLEDHTKGLANSLSLGGELLAMGCSAPLLITGTMRWLANHKDGKKKMLLGLTGVVLGLLIPGIVNFLFCNMS